MVALLLESAKLYTNTVSIGVSKLTMRGVRLCFSHYVKDCVPMRPADEMFFIGNKAQRSEPFR